MEILTLRYLKDIQVKMLSKQLDMGLWSSKERLRLIIKINMGVTGMKKVFKARKLNEIT